MIIKNNCFKTVILLILFCFFTNHALAKKADYANIKNDSYKTIAESFFNNNTYKKFRVEIVQTIGKLSDPTDKTYEEDDQQGSIIDRTIRSIITAVTKKLDNKKGNYLAFNEDELEDKVNEVLSKDDASLVYMLAEALNDKNYSIQLYASTYLIKSRDKSTYPLFIELLDDKKNQHKIIALNVLGNIGCKEAIPKISDIITNTALNEKVRLNALNALEKIDMSKAAELSKSLINDPRKSVQYKAISILVKNNNPRGIEAFKELLDNKTTAKHALVYLNEIADYQQEDSLDLLNEIYENGEPFTKGSVFSALHKYKNKNVAYDLIDKALKSDNDQVVIPAISLLSTFNPKKNAAIISEVMLSKPEYYSGVAKILMKANNNFMDQVLKEYLKKDDEKLQLMISAYFLNKNVNTDIAKSTLTKLLKSKDDLVQKRAALVLVSNNYKEGEEEVKQLLDSTNSTIKANAVLALAKQDNKAIIPYLKEAIQNNTNPKKAYGAALILYNLGDDEYIDILVKYLSRKDIDVINSEFLNKKLFRNLTKNSNKWVQLNSAASLLQTGDLSSLKVVKELINDDDIQIRSKALKLLGEYGTTEDIDLLYSYLDDDYVRIRVYASEALLRIIHRDENQHRS